MLPPKILIMNRNISIPILYVNSGSCVGRNFENEAEQVILMQNIERRRQNQRKMLNSLNSAVCYGGI